MNDKTTVENISKPGEVKCDELFILTQDMTKYDLMHESGKFVFEVILREDIWSPTLSGSVEVTDAVNAISKWPIRGGEVLVMKYRTSTFEDKPANIIEKSFQIYSIENRKLNNDREQLHKRMVLQAQ